MRNRCLLCDRELKPIGRQLQRHPDVADCEVRFTDGYGVAVEEFSEDEPEPQSTVVFQTWPLVDDVLAEAFQEFELRRLGGASSGSGWTSFSIFQRCPYAWWRRYIAKKEPTILIESPSRAIGSLVHAFLALYYTGMMDSPYRELSPEMLYERVRIKANPEFVAEAWRVFTAYTLYYAHEEIVPLAIEYDLKDPRTYESCRFDLIAFFPNTVGDRAAGTYNIEHKTASRFDQDTLDGWQCDGEVIGQVALWKRLGLDKRFGELRGTIVNILGKHKEPRFHRTLVAPTSLQIEQHLEDLKRWEGLMHLAVSMQTFPRARAGCIGRYGRCDYFDHCAGVDV